MPRADANLQTASAEMVDAGQLPDEMDRVVKVVVEDQRAHPERSRALGHRDQRRQRGPAVDDVVPGVDHVQAGVLGRARVGAQLFGGALPQLVAEAEPVHIGSLVGSRR